jgi:hypothetical protein
MRMPLKPQVTWVQVSRKVSPPVVQRIAVSQPSLAGLLANQQVASRLFAVPMQDVSKTFK